MSQSIEIRDTWAGVLPSNWQMRPLGALATFFKGLPILKTDLTDEGTAVISYGQVHAKANTGTGISDALIRYIPPSMAASSSKLQFGDLVFADTSEDLAGLGNAAFVNTFSELYSGYHTITCRLNTDSVEPKFLAYLVQTDAWRSQLRAYAMGVKVFSLTRALLSPSKITLPPLDEQKQIVAALDTTLEKIDRALQLLNEQIFTLENYKKSLIFETVTKGLDAKAVMKPSGVDWIGDIPEHWAPKDLKYVSDFGGGTTPDSSNLSYYDVLGIPWIQSGDLYQTTRVSTTDKAVTPLALREISVLTIYKKPFVVVAMYGASVGNTALSTIDACVNQACCVLQPKSSLNIYYLTYCMQIARSSLIQKAQGGTQPNISQFIIKNESIPIPPISEQEAIVDFLDEKCEIIERVIANKSEQLELLRQQRHSLIFEFVTGKRRAVEGAEDALR